jgi:Phage integrase, N-terminal SAM-like domain
VFGVAPLIVGRYPFRGPGGKRPAMATEGRRAMTPLRERMIGDMKLAGLSPRTRQAYTQAVKRLAMHYRRRPDRLDEEAVRAFLVGAINAGMARGTFKRVHFGLKFFYTTTLGRDWLLFSKKTASACRSRSVCPRPSPTSRFAACSPA